MRAQQRGATSVYFDVYKQPCGRFDAYLDSQLLGTSGVTPMPEGVPDGERICHQEITLAELGYALPAGDAVSPALKAQLSVFSVA